LIHARDGFRGEPPELRDEPAQQLGEPRLGWGTALIPWAAIDTGGRSATAYITIILL
jgi:hypothetical protein